MPLPINRLIWIDLEMTGLDTENDTIIEIATIITDANLNTIAEGPALAISHPPAVINAMDAWNTKTHGASGLIDRIAQSQITLAHAEQQTLDFLSTHVDKNTSPMCGNSICQDRRFLHRLMPNLEAYFHYRHLDVSSLKILAQCWYPEELISGLKKNTTHTALQDVRDSIAECQYYRDKLFIPSTL